MNYLKYVTLFSVCFLMILSCKEDTISKDLLTEQQMINVLTDIHIAESALSINNFTRDTSLALFTIYEAEILKNHSITVDQLRTSYIHYSQKSKAMDRIYAAVVDSLAVRESRGKLK